MSVFKKFIVNKKTENKKTSKECFTKDISKQKIIYFDNGKLEIESLEKIEKSLNLIFPDFIYDIFNHNLFGLERWVFLEADQMENLINELFTQFSEHKLIPFAIKSNPDEIACFKIKENGEVFIINALAPLEQYNIRKYDDFKQWLINAKHEYLFEEISGFKIINNTLKTANFTLDFKYPIEKIIFHKDIYVVMLLPKQGLEAIEVIDHIYGVNHQGEIIWRIESPEKAFNIQDYNRTSGEVYVELKSGTSFSARMFLGIEHKFDYQTGKLLDRKFVK